MSKILTFPSPAREFAPNDDRAEPTDSVARWDETQSAVGDLLALRAKAKLEIENAIAALENSYARMREGAWIVRDPSTRTKLQNDLDFLEQQLKRAKLEAARL